MILRAYLLLSAFFLSSAAALASDSAYLRHVDNRTSNVITELDSGWTWVNTGKQISLPYSFNDSIASATISRQLFFNKGNPFSTVRIWFLGISGQSEITFNGHVLHQHHDFHSPFHVLIPENMINRDKPNALQITLQRQVNEDSGLVRQVNLFREKDYLSISREIYLEWLPNLYFDHFIYEYQSPVLNYAFRIYSSSTEEENIRLEEQIIDPAGKIVFNRYEYLEPNNQQIRRQITLNDAIQWSQDDPALYRVELRLIDHLGNEFYYSQQIGLRSISVSDHNILINNKSIEIRGVTYRENRNIIASGHKYYETIRNDLKSIKELKFNAVRIPFSVPHPYIAQLCDSIGLLLFIENWAWRLPGHYFKIDRILRLTKLLGDEIFAVFYGHPSFVGFGIGHELPLAEPSAQKFILIVNEYFKQRFKFISYASPLNPKSLPNRPLTDIYLFNFYEHAVFDIMQSYRLDQQIPIVFGNVGFARTEHVYGQQLSVKWSYFLQQFRNQDQFSGYFVESFRDFPAEVRSRLTRQNETSGEHIYYYGISSEPALSKLILEANPTASIDRPTAQRYRTNFFSLCVFVSTVLFFLLYRNNIRLRENVKRAITHPYGFFMDLRDRRIISISSSTILALFTTLIVANIQAAYLYFYQNNLLLEEYFSTILKTDEAKNVYLHISKSPSLSFGIFWLGSYFLQLLTAVVIKIFGIFSKTKSRFKQALAVSNWSSAPILFFIPVSLLSMQLLNIPSLQPFLLGLVLLLIFWYHVRLVNGIRILFITRPIRVIIIIILTYVGLVCIFFVFFDVNYELISYWLLLRHAISLFPIF